MKNPPKWLTRLEGTDRIKVEAYSGGVRVIRSRGRGRATTLLWGSCVSESPGLRMEGRRLKDELDAARRKTRLSYEHKVALAAQRIVQPIKGTGHKPGEHISWLKDYAPRGFVDYLKQAPERPKGFYKLSLRWPERLDGEIRTIAKQYGREVPEGINFIKSERSLSTWGATGSVSFDTPDDAIITSLLWDLTDEKGDGLNITDKNGRTTITDSRFAFQLFFEEGLPLS